MCRAPASIGLFPGIKVAAIDWFVITPLRKETILQLPTLREGVGGDMARDTYEMTSPMHVLSYGLGIAKCIPPAVAVSSFKSHCPIGQLSTLLLVC